MPSTETKGTESGRTTTGDAGSGGPAKDFEAEKKPNEVKILMADDNIVSRQALQLMIEKLGYHIDIVENGALALKALEKNRYDLLLLDLQMPVMDGITAAKRILGKYSDQERPVLIALTGSSTKEDEKACMNAGMDGFIAKPIRLNELKKLLEERLNWSRRTP